MFNELNKTLHILKIREEENREKINHLAKLNSYEFLEDYNLASDPAEEEEEPEVILVNIWNQVNGKLLLKEKKPFSKKEFEQMEKMKDFSGLFSSEQDRIPPVVQVNYREPRQSDLEPNLPRVSELTRPPL